MHTNAAGSELFDNLRLELRRGCLVVAVLAQLYTEHYGYALRKALGDQGLVIDENTLYPLLRRLESQGLFFLGPLPWKCNFSEVDFGIQDEPFLIRLSPRRAPAGLREHDDCG